MEIYFRDIGNYRMIWCYTVQRLHIPKGDIAIMQQGNTPRRRFTVEMGEEERSFLTALAKQVHRSRSATIRWLIRKEAQHLNLRPRQEAEE